MNAFSSKMLVAQPLPTALFRRGCGRSSMRGELKPCHYWRLILANGMGWQLQPSFIIIQQGSWLKKSAERQPRVPMELWRRRYFRLVWARSQRRSWRYEIALRFKLRSRSHHPLFVPNLDGRAFLFRMSRFPLYLLWWCYLTSAYFSRASWIFLHQARMSRKLPTKL